MRRRTTAVLGLLLLACGREPDDAHTDGEHGDSHAEEAHAEEPADQGLLVIDPQMLGDLRITTAEAEARAGGEGVTVLGEVAVNEDAYTEVGSSLAARVVEVQASPGERVERGDALAVLESPELGRARAAHVAARAHAELARSALARKRELMSERIVAGREVQEAEAEAAGAEAELRAARGALLALGVGEEEAARGAIDPRFTLRAPLSGTVLERTAVQGQMTDPARALFRIGDLSRLWLGVHAFERDAIRVEPGVRARLSFAALPGRSVEGTVTLIGSQVDSASRTIPIRIEVDNADGALRPGMSASAWIPLGDAGDAIVAVPAAALQRSRDGWSVFLVRGNGRFEVRAVGRGRDLGGEVEIVSGLAAGEQVVVDGAFLLKAEQEKLRGEGAHHDH
jgi:cobalt-zinc-cadmium efflux system membrane fusion protein